MDLTIVYAKKRETEERLRAQFPNGYCMAISVNPQNNGPTEVTLAIAANLLAEGQHRLASEAEIAEFNRLQELTRAVNTSGVLQSARAQFGIQPSVANRGK